MMTDMLGDERFSVVKEDVRRVLRCERRRGDGWETVWENDAILPDGEMGWLYINGYAGSGEWHTEWFTRETGPQVSLYGARDADAEHEDFNLGLEQGPDGAWFVVTYADAEADVYAWLFEDSVLFCDGVPDIAKGVCEEAPNRDAATFDPKALKAMEVDSVPYAAPEEDGPDGEYEAVRPDGTVQHIALISETERFSIVRENGQNGLRLEEKRGDSWETVWANGNLLPNDDFGWLAMNVEEADEEIAHWDRVSRRVGRTQLYLYAAVKADAEHEDFSLSMSRDEGGAWQMDSYCDSGLGVYALLTDDGILFNADDFAAVQTAGFSFETVNRDAAAFNPKALKAAAERLKKAAEGAPIVDFFANAEPLYIAPNEKATCPVHTRPSAVSLRAADGKAAVSLSGWLMLLCRKGDWAFVLYETKPGRYRTGWIEGAQNDRLERAVRMTQEAAFRWYGGTINKDTVLMDDPIHADGVLGTVPKGTRVTYLDVMTARKADGGETEALVYVETVLNGQAWRGFIRGDDIDLDDTASFG